MRSQSERAQSANSIEIKQWFKTFQDNVFSTISALQSTYNFALGIPENNVVSIRKITDLIRLTRNDVEVHAIQGPDMLFEGTL
jgi:hypothetical protein